MKKMVLSVMLLLLIPVVLLSQRTERNENVAQAIDTHMKVIVDREQFSGEVLFARGDKVIFSRGYSFANRRYDLPVTSETKFLLASGTKAFTAAAILLLADRDLLRIDDAICKYIAECPVEWQHVSIRNLLNHTCGITEFGKPAPANDCFRRTPMTTAAAVERLKQFKPDFVPGEKFAYSSADYVLLGAIIERVSGVNFDAFMQKNLFSPLGLNRTGVWREKTIIKNLAEGYSRKKDGTIENFDYFDLDYLFSAGGIYSTAGDLFRWARELTADKFLSNTSRNLIFTPGLENSGFGWEIYDRSSRKLFRSGGRSFGFSNAVTIYPDRDITLIVLCNLDPVSSEKISDELAELIFREK